MRIQPYLNFNGRAEEAMTFYKQAVNAQGTFLMRCKEAPEGPPVRPGLEDKIMHAEFTIGESTVMCSDGYCTGEAPAFQGVTLTIVADSDAQARERFDALADGGSVQMPLGKTFFASSFGMLTDRFGVSWMVIAGQQP